MDDERIPQPDDVEPANATPGIGEILRAAREARGVTIEQASDLLRIEPQFLVALEDERFDAIGPPVFVKGYLRHYCELLGVDAGPLLDALRERIAGGEPQLKGRRPVEDEEKPAAVMPAAIGAAVVVAIMIAWWLLGRTPGDVDSQTAAPESAVTEIADESGASAVARGFGAERGARGTASASTPIESAPLTAAPTADSADPPVSAPDGSESGAIPAAAGFGPAERAAPPAEPGFDTAAGGSVLAEPGSEPAEPATAVAASAADADAALEIELRFTEDSWTEITAASGERLFYGLASAGREERILTDDEVSVRLGNAGGVSIRVNGEPFAFPPGSRRGTLAVFRLSPPED